MGNNNPPVEFTEKTFRTKQLYVAIFNNVETQIEIKIYSVLRAQTQGKNK